MLTAQFPFVDVLSVYTGKAMGSVDGYRAVYSFMIGRPIHDHEIVIWHPMVRAFVHAQMDGGAIPPPPDFSGVPSAERRAAVDEYVARASAAYGSDTVTLRAIEPAPKMEHPVASFAALLDEYQTGRR